MGSALVVRGMILMSIISWDIIRGFSGMLETVLLCLL